MDIYHKNPIFLLYWIVLKKKFRLSEWKTIMKGAGYGERYPFSEAIRIIDEFGIDDE